jgi:hypothetical protein
MGSQPPGWVCLVTVGHGVVVEVGLGGSVVMPVMTVLLVLVEVVVVVVVGLGLDR